MNLASLLDTHPVDRLALLSRGRRTTFGELQDQVGRLRGGLSRLGVDPGDRVAIVASNNWYFVVSYLAILGVGAVAVPLNPQSPRAALTREMSNVAVRAAIIGPSAKGHLGDLSPEDSPGLEFLVGAGFTPTGGTSLDDLMDGAPTEALERSEDDLAVLVARRTGAPRSARS